MAERVLITGMSGLIGGALAQALATDYELSAFNRSEVAGYSTFQGDLSDANALAAACDGQDVVVHLAAKAGEQFSWDELLQTNVIGTRNVFDAAARAGCRRVVFASSGATVAGWEREEPYRSLVEGRYEQAGTDWPLIRHDAATRPAGIYGSSKVWGESIARHYCDSAGLPVINVRIGYVNQEDRPINRRHWSVWCSQRDVVDVLARSVALDPELRFETVFVNSANRWGYRDLSHTRAVLGFTPNDSADDFAQMPDGPG